jgi:hypothetical protein
VKRSVESCCRHKLAVGGASRLGLKREFGIVRIEIVSIYMRTTKPLLAVEQHGKMPQVVQCFMLLPEICRKIYLCVCPVVVPLLTVTYESKVGGCPSDQTRVEFVPP